MSPQSLSPSHFHSVRTQRWLWQVNSFGRQVGCEQLECSSELSPQSSSRSQTNRFGMHRVLLHKNLSEPQPSGRMVAVKWNLSSGFWSFQVELKDSVGYKCISCLFEVDFAACKVGLDRQTCKSRSLYKTAVAKWISKNLRELGETKKKRDDNTTIL